MTDEELWLYTLCKKNRLPITDIQLQQLSHFKELLLDWNKKINLISRKNEEHLWKGHIALSLSMLFKITFPSGAKILDIGTGGGFPGIPLAILLQKNSFLLLDSTQKKINAVQSMAEELQLTNIKTVWGRAEDLQKLPHYKLQFDFVVARSVSNLTNLIEWGIPFLRKSKNADAVNRPALITFKGTVIEEEEKEAKKKFPSIIQHNIPLLFSGSEEFENLDKKLVVLTES